MSDPYDMTDFRDRVEPPAKLVRPNADKNAIYAKAMQTQDKMNRSESGSGATSLLLITLQASRTNSSETG